MLSSTFHDGKLISIAVTDDVLAIEVFAQDKITKIQLSGLEKLRVTDFKEGNIINAVRVVRPKLPPSNDDVGKSLMKYAYELDDAVLERNEKFSFFLDKKLKEYEEGSVLILEIEPSYGAYLVAIGKKISEEETSI